MVTFEFDGLELMRLPVGIVVCGRCGDAEFGVGDTFTELRWSVHERRESPLKYVRIDENIEAKVRLLVEEIRFYDRLIDRLYPGCTAGLRLSGQGLELISKIDSEADFRVGKSWSLWGQRPD